MKECISRVYERKQDATLVDKYLKCDDTYLTYLMIRDNDQEILAACMRAKDAQKNGFAPLDGIDPLIADSTI